jgi:hypothetical protein
MRLLVLVPKTFLQESHKTFPSLARPITSTPMTGGSLAIEKRRPLRDIRS